MSIDLIQLSKTMAYALHHQPEQFGLYLDSATIRSGWPIPSLQLLSHFHEGKKR